MADYGDALASSGLPVVHIRMDPAELQYGVDLVSAGQGSLRVHMARNRTGHTVKAGPEGQVRNLWEAFGVPLVKFHGDLPAYFVDYHGDVPRNAVNLYAAPEFMHFRRRWLPGARALTAVIAGLPISPLGRSDVDTSARRRGKLVFLKNGNSPAELRQLWEERLPQSIARLVSNMADQITPIGMKPGLLHIGDFVGEYLDANGFDSDSACGLVPFFSAQMDDYLRRFKSQMIAAASRFAGRRARGPLAPHRFHGSPGSTGPGPGLRDVSTSIFRTARNHRYGA